MLAVVLALLAAGFSYAHQRIYQRSIERDLMDQATRVLRTRPELHKVSVSFEGLDARLGGSVADPAHRKLAQDLVDQLPGARAANARNQIRVIASIQLQLQSNGVWQASGWLPSAAWQERAVLLLSPGAPGRLDTSNLRADPSVSEPSFLNHPLLPALGQTALSAVLGGTIEMEVQRLRLTGRVRSDVERARILETAGRIWNGMGGTTIEEHLEPVSFETRTNAPTRDFSWAGFDLGRVLKSFPIFFDSGATAIKSEELGKIGRLSSAIRQLAPAGRFRVTGYADAAGNAAANQKLSLRRAEAVASQLAQQGVARSQLEISTQIESVPGGRNASAEARKRSRRVEVSIK